MLLYVAVVAEGRVAALDVAVVAEGRVAALEVAEGLLYVDVVDCRRVVLYGLYPQPLRHSHRQVEQ